MFRLIRLVCFPIARRIGCWPIAVYFALVGPLIVIRRIVYPLPEDALAQLPVWFFPALYGFVLVGFPLLAYVRKGGWFDVPERGR